MRPTVSEYDEPGPNHAEFEPNDEYVADLDDDLASDDEPGDDGADRDESGVDGDADVGGEPEAEPARAPESPFEEFAAAWVPPWARAHAELVIEPASDYSPEELAVGRLVYADADGQELPDPEAFEPGMDSVELRAALEAILMVVDEPVTSSLLAHVLEEPSSRIEMTLMTLADEYTAAGRGFELRQVAGGWRVYTRGAYASYVEKFVLDGQQIRLTQAALETLAVVAYKQPVTRSRVAAIRGVNCDGVMKTLVTRGLVEECGVEHESGAHLYRTTRLFLEKVGINSVEDLPPIAPFIPTDIDELDLAQR
jgi:segregation and condensation protein B